MGDFRSKRGTGKLYIYIIILKTKEIIVPISNGIIKMKIYLENGEQI